MVTSRAPLVTRWARAVTYGSPSRTRATPVEAVVPGVGSGLPVRRVAVAYVAAIVVPAVVAAAMVPIRVDHAQTTALLLVVPVVGIAVLGSVRPGLLAALVAGISYDLLLTAPYFRLAIDDTDDIVATATLLVVGLLVGLVTAQLAREVALHAVRVDELQHLTGFARTASHATEMDVLVDAACGRISSVLHLRRCTWNERYAGGAHALLSQDGVVTRRTPPDGPRLPGLAETIELPAVGPTGEIGRFILTTHPDARSSREQLITAASIATVFASAVHSLRSVDGS